MQLIARGILLPEEPSSASVSASDLDFSNLSLDSGMDRLSRLADSLVEGVTPGSRSTQAAQPDSIPAVFQHMPATSSRSDQAAGGKAAPRQTAAAVGHAAIRGNSWCSQQESPLQETGASDIRTDSATSESASESARLQSHSTNRTHEDWQAPSYLQHGSDPRTHRQTSQTPAPHARPAGDMALSAHPSDAMSQSRADTASLCQHSLASDQPGRGTHQQHHGNAAESIWSRRTSEGGSDHAAGDGTAGFAEQARASHSFPDDTLPEKEGCAAQLSQTPPHEVSDRCVSASEAEAARSAAEQTGSDHSWEDDVASQGDLASCGGRPGCDADLAEEGGANVTQHAQREGLLSDSEEEFENSILAARQLRPANIAATR